MCETTLKSHPKASAPPAYGHGSVILPQGEPGAILQPPLLDVHRKLSCQIEQVRICAENQDAKNVHKQAAGSATRSDFHRKRHNTWQISSITDNEEGVGRRGWYYTMRALVCRTVTGSHRCHQKPKHESVAIKYSNTVHTDYIPQHGLL